MIKTCYNYCRQMVPVKKHHTVLAQNNVLFHYIACDNDLDISKLAGPYTDKAKEIASRMEENQEKRFLLVSNDLNSVEKTALILSGVELDEDDYEDYDDYVDYDDYEEENLNAHCVVAHISFKEDGSNCGGNEKSYIKELAACRAGDFRNVLFTDLMVHNDLQLQTDVIMAAKDFNKVFVAVTREQLQTTCVKQLIYDADFVPVTVPDLDDEYYECIWEFLTKNDVYKLSPEISIKHLNRTLHRKFGKCFSEEMIAMAIDMAIEKAGDRELLEIQDFSVVKEFGEESAVDKLEQSVGRAELKKIAKEYTALSQEMQRNPKLKTRQNHMLFYGNPGTGKTTGAKLLADVIAEEGFGNGNFVVAERKDLIGSYVGQTAPKIATKFQDARGGILFVDEAGFLLNHSEYTEEAVREFVRYMEEYSDVTVIFALYPNEVNQLMALDAGLTSRISKFVHFQDYTENELIDICRQMFDEKGYEMKKNCDEVIESYIKKGKSSDAERFGNARDIRKLVDASVVAVSMRHMDEQQKRKDTGTYKKKESRKRQKNVISVEDIKEGIESLAKVKQERKHFGF